MNAIWLYSIVSVLIVSIVSFVGVLTLGIKAEKLKKILIYFISFSAGALFGDAFIHLMPEIIENSGWSLAISFYLLLGILIFFILEKIVHYQQYHCHGEECENELEHQDSIKKSKHKHIASFAYMSLIGSTLHNFVDGIIIAASYVVSFPLGLATTLAVILHEVPHELGDFSILVHGGFSKAKALFINFISALVSLLGVVFTLLLNSSINNLTMIVVPIATGGFIYVAGSDLIPELHKHSGIKSSVIQVIAFIIGILIMAGLLVFG
jgi:zinc and cadmium transporter